MNKEEQKEKDSELEMIEIEEFKTSRPQNQYMTTKKSSSRGILEMVQSVPVILGIFILEFLTAILLGMFLFQMPAAAVCMILVLEAFLAVCLHNEPVWVHGLEMCISIAAGIIFGELPFMIAAALVYFGAVLALHFMNELDTP